MKYNDKVFTIVLLNSKLISFTAAILVALDLKLDQPTATVIVAFFVAVSSMWQSYTLSRVHTLVNSNFTEAKLARVAAEAALKTSQDLNVHLQQQLDLAKEKK